MKNGMSTTSALTQRQISRIQRLPKGHKLVSTSYGAPVVRRPDGRLLRVQPDGRLAASTSVERIESYLNLRG